MKKIFNYIKENWPLFLYYGIFIIIPAVFLLWALWDSPKIQMLGNGSTLLGILILIFALIGFINIAIATLLWFKKVMKALDDNGIESIFALFAIVVISILGLFAFILAIIRVI